jgi:heat shock protein HslJ
MTVRWPGSVGVFLLAGLLTACGTMASAADAPGLEGSSWVLSGIPGRTLLPASSATLQFAEGRVSGSDGCNRYAGPYQASGGKLVVSSQLAATQMACPPEVMELSRSFVAALTGARSYRIVEGRLELLAADGKVLATFAAQSQSLAGTNWRVTGVNNGKGGVASLRQDTSVTLAFSADGRASGSAGCNNFTAGYRSEASTLAFSQAAATRKMCVQPEGVMEQEQQFLAALGTVSTARIEGDRLELRTAAGALAVSAVRTD